MLEENAIKKTKDTNSRYYSTFEIDISIPQP